VWLNDMDFSDLSWVADMNALTSLRIQHNDQLTDISPIAGVQNLETFEVGFAPVQDLSPLAGLLNLEAVSFINTQIDDLTPLVNNMGIDQDDEVFLLQNPLSDDAIEAQIPALLARGVRVKY